MALRPTPANSSIDLKNAPICERNMFKVTLTSVHPSAMSQPGGD